MIEPDDGCNAGTDRPRGIAERVSEGCRGRTGSRTDPALDRKAPLECLERAIHLLPRHAGLLLETIRSVGSYGGAHALFLVMTSLSFNNEREVRCGFRLWARRVREPSTTVISPTAL